MSVANAKNAWEGHRRSVRAPGFVCALRSRLYDELVQARADGTYFLLLRRLAKTAVLLIDDVGLEVLNASQRRDFLEVMEYRYGTSSTVITSQFDSKDRHPVIGDETIADSVCDRFVLLGKRSGAKRP